MDGRSGRIVLYFSSGECITVMFIAWPALVPIYHAGTCRLVLMVPNMSLNVVVEV